MKRHLIIIAMLALLVPGLLLAQEGFPLEGSAEPLSTVAGCVDAFDEWVTALEGEPEVVYCTPSVESHHPKMLKWHDFNARHAATFLWGTAILILAVASSADVRRSICEILTILLKPAISLLIVGLLANVVVLTIIAVIVGRKIGIWETLPVVTAMVWAFTAGVSLLFHLGEFLKGENAFKSRVVALLGPSTVVAEIMGVAILSFWWELFLVPILVVLVSAVYTNRSTGLAIVPTVLLLAYAAGLISKVIIDLVVDPKTLQSLAQAILFPFVLTIGTFPYIQLLVILERIRFSRSAKCKTVRSTEYGKDWPLTVDSAKLCCRSQAVWVEVNGRKYGVNGTASGILKIYGYECFELNDIWRDHPDKKEAVKTVGDDLAWKVSTHRLFRDGLALEQRE